MNCRPLSFRAMLFCVFAATAAACKEEGGVKVSSFTFNGTKAVTPNQLKSVLATSASSKIPWGQKHYFSRDQFEADLKRIVAFYRDRGYPDARVTSFDAKMNDTQTSVSITVNISEGDPIRVERVTFTGFEPLPEQHRTALESGLPLKSGQPLDRALLQASREAALDELKDHGYPYATVKIAENPGSAERERVVLLTADAGPLAHFGPIEINGNVSVDDNVVRRQLTYRPGQIFRQSALQESQRRLYGPELFDFANVEPLRQDEKPPEVPTRVTVTEGKHQKVNFGVGLRDRRERARAGRLAARELPRWRAHGRRARALFGTRQGRSGQLQGAVPLRPAKRFNADRPIVAHRRARLHARHQRRPRDVCASVAAAAAVPFSDRDRRRRCR